MNKLFTKIAALALGATMAIGVGVAVAKNTSIAPVRADSSFTVEFKDNGTSSDGSSDKGASPNASDIVKSSSLDYVGSFSGCSKLYLGKTGYGIKIGASGNPGTVNFSLASDYQANIKSIKVVSAKFGSDTGTLTLYNGSTSLKSGITPGTDYTHTFTSATTVSSVKLTTSAKRAYILSLEFTVEGSGGGGGGGGGDTPAGDGWVVDTNNFDKVGSGTGYVPYNGSHTLNGYSYTTNQVMVQSSSLQFQKSNSYFYNTTSFGKITKITLESGSNLNIRVNNSAFTGRNTSTGTTTTSGATISGTNGFFLIYDNGNTGTCASISIESTTATYTVSFGVNTAGYGTVSQASITDVPSGATISSSNNTVTINGTTVTATPTTSGAQYTYAFKDWTNASGTVTSDMTITANFTRTTNSYTATWKNYDGTTLETDQNVPYGTTPTYNGATPTKPATAEYTYTFSGWSPTPAAITGNTTYTAQFNQTKNTFTVTGNIEHGSLSDNTPIEYGGDLAVQIVHAEGYEYPTEVTVTMGGNDITESVVYDPTDGSILCEGVTGNIVITAECSAHGNIYAISANITNGGYSGDEEIAEEGEASITIQPNSGYKLPLQKSDVSVANAVEWDYDPTTGVVSILGAEGDVVVTTTCPPLDVYQINVIETNGSHTGPSTIQEKGSATLVFTPATGCGQPTDVTVSGATKSWDNGTLTLTNPTGSVSVTYVGVENKLDSITLSADSGTFTLGDDFVMPTVTAHYTVSADVVVTGSATYSGYNKYATGEQSVTISYTEGSITKTESYTATVSTQSVSYSYNKISSVSDITEGDYIIAYSTYGFDNRDAVSGYTAVTINNDSIVQSVATDKLAVHITPTTGGYNLQVSPTSDDNKGKYISYTSGSNTLSFVDSPVAIPISLVSGSTFATYESGGAFAIGGTDNLFAYNGTSGQERYRFYKIATTAKEGQTSYFAPDLYKKVSSGTADLIRITATYTGGEKYVGDPISASDFAVKKQLNTGEELIDVASGYTISANTLESTSNTITVSYTENNITETADVVVPATERSASVTSVTLVQGAGVVKNYVDWSGVAWDYTGLTVECVWDDSTYNETFNLADLITAGTASVSPAKPAKGVTSFTVTYSYHEVQISDGTVSGITVTDDYIESVSWIGKHKADFKAFSGTELTTATVSGWTVKAKYKGAGYTDALSFGTGANQFTIKVGDKSVTSLPYTWLTEDDGEEVKVVVGGIEGRDQDNAIANICATINAIDHTESETIVVPIFEYTLASDVPSMSIGDTKQVIIAANVGGTYHAMSSISSKKGQSYIPTVTNSKISGDDAEYVWTLTKTSTGYTLSDENGQIKTGTNTDISTAEKGTDFSIESGVNGTFRITPSSGTNRPIIYRSSTFNVFGGYAASNVSAGGNEYYDLELFVGANTGSREETITTTVHYANQMEHFDAQKKVVEFAKFMNTTMNGANVCSGTFANLESAWDDVAGKYDELFGADTKLDATELAWAKNMFKYATAVWGSDAEPACVEKAMKTYDHCVGKYGLDPFMDGVRSAERVGNTNPIAIINSKTDVNVVAIVVVTSVISLTAIGGYFFLGKRREQN